MPTYVDTKKPGLTGQEMPANNRVEKNGWGKQDRLRQHDSTRQKNIEQDRPE
jgi:hypothetical protein